MLDLIDSLTAGAPDATSLNWEDTVDWDESDNMSQEARRSMACRILSSLSMTVDPAFLAKEHLKKEPGQSIWSSSFGKVRRVWLNFMKNRLVRESERECVCVCGRHLCTYNNV